MANLTDIEILYKIREEDERFKNGGKYPQTLKKLIDSCEFLGD